MPKMFCHVATPTRDRFIGEVYYASVPGTEGSFGVLPGHELFVGNNAHRGVATIWLDEDGNQRKEFLVMDGMTQVLSNAVKILGRFCKDKSEVDAEDCRENIAIQSSILENLEGKDDELSQLERDVAQERLEWYQFQLEAIGAE